MDGPEDLHTSTVDAAAAFERGRAEAEDDFIYDEDLDVDDADGFYDDYDEDFDFYDEDYCGCGDTLYCPACG